MDASTAAFDPKSARRPKPARRYPASWRDIFDISTRALKKVYLPGGMGASV
jgi:hypothetical protein